MLVEVLAVAPAVRRRERTRATRYARALLLAYGVGITVTDPFTQYLQYSALLLDNSAVVDHTPNDRLPPYFPRGYSTHCYRRSTHQMDRMSGHGYDVMLGGIAVANPLPEMDCSSHNPPVLQASIACNICRTIQPNMKSMETHYGMD